MRIVQATLLFYAAILVLDLGYFMVGKYRVGGFEADVIPVYSLSASEAGQAHYRVQYEFEGLEMQSVATLLDHNLDSLTPDLLGTSACLSCEQGQCYLDIEGTRAVARRAAQLFHQRVSEQSDLSGRIWLMTAQQATLG